MHGAELIMWIIATLLACWSLAIFFRLFDERRFFRKHPGSPAKRSGTTWAGAAGAVAFCLAVATGAMAIWFARVYPSGRSAGVGILFVSGLASGMFALGMFALWIRGEPARGRRRCARCIYDMTEVPSRCCPECGHEPADERGLFRTRRPRWILRTTILIAVFSASMLTLAPRSAQFGTVGAIPSWALMLSYKHVPDRWMYGDDGSLYERIEHRTIDAARINRFGNQLIQTMINDPIQRNRNVNWTVLDEIFNDQETIDPSLPNTPQNTRFNYPRNVDNGVLMLLITQERIDRLEPLISNPNAPIEFELCRPTLSVSEWITRQLIEDRSLDSDGRWPLIFERSEEAQAAIREHTARSGALKIPDGFHTLIDNEFPDVLIEYASLAGQLGDHNNAMKAIANAGDGNGWELRYQAHRQICISLALADPDIRAAFTNQVGNWITNGTTKQADYAIDIESHYLAWARRLGVTPVPEANVLLQALIDTAMARTDDRPPTWNGTIQDLAVSRLCTDRKSVV